ncbi:DUF1330 domain-containing protein [Pseudoruegeria sp. HB172150]|uniref:DUF1330 domain-containing protein n=1 Tax=Pseudoruegeria sp. HB172150 TaxID=2721164 RepID=UPI0015574ABE|nr:DUF1330 domain-containing protein [Pseudoruegeria sp. HB172150]
MTYLNPTDATARALFSNAHMGPVVMVNLLRFRDVADYSAHPGKAPATPTSGAEAYARYVAETLPLLEASGGEVLFEGTANRWFIGPETERWDHVLIVKQASLQSFLAFASDPAAQSALVHRAAAVEDSRLLPSFPLDG